MRWEVEVDAHAVQFEVVMCHFHRMEPSLEVKEGEKSYVVKSGESDSTKKMMAALAAAREQWVTEREQLVALLRKERQKHEEDVQRLRELLSEERRTFLLAMKRHLEKEE